MQIPFGNTKTSNVESCILISTSEIYLAHPNSAYRNLFPYGKGEYFVGKPNYDLKFCQIACCRVKVSYCGVRLHSVIKLIGLDCIDDLMLTLWDFEIELMKKAYIDLEIQYIDGYMYKAKKLRWRKFYEINYNLRRESKAKKDLFNVMRYKLLNNGSYGKFLEKAHNEIYIPKLDEEEIITSDIKQKESEEVESKYTYLPIGSCISAYTRCKLISTGLLFNYYDNKGNYVNNIQYVDTDSLFIAYNKFTKKIYESDLIDKQDHLGGWAIEEISERAEFSCAKRYKLMSGGKTIIKMGGINFDREVMFDEINIDFNKFNVRRAYRVKGGTIIDFQEKEIKVQDKFKSIYNRNKKK